MRQIAPCVHPLPGIISPLEPSAETFLFDEDVEPLISLGSGTQSSSGDLPLFRTLVKIVCVTLEIVGLLRSSLEPLDLPKSSRHRLTKLTSTVGYDLLNN